MPKNKLKPFFSWTNIIRSKYFQIVAIFSVIVFSHVFKDNYHLQRLSWVICNFFKMLTIGIVVNVCNVFKSCVLPTLWIFVKLFRFETIRSHMLEKLANKWFDLTTTTTKNSVLTSFPCFSCDLTFRPFSHIFSWFLASKRFQEINWKFRSNGGLCCNNYWFYFR